MRLFPPLLIENSEESRVLSLTIQRSDFVHVSTHPLHLRPKLQKRIGNHWEFWVREYGGDAGCRGEAQVCGCAVVMRKLDEGKWEIDQMGRERLGDIFVIGRVLSCGCDRG